MMHKALCQSNQRCVVRQLSSVCGRSERSNSCKLMRRFAATDAEVTSIRLKKLRGTFRSLVNFSE